MDYFEPLVDLSTKIVRIIALGSLVFHRLIYGGHLFFIDSYMGKNTENFLSLIKSGERYRTIMVLLFKYSSSTYQTSFGVKHLESFF